MPPSGMAARSSSIVCEMALSLGEISFSWMPSLRILPVSGVVASTVSAAIVYRTVYRVLLPAEIGCCVNHQDERKGLQLDVNVSEKQKGGCGAVNTKRVEKIRRRSASRTRRGGAEAIGYTEALETKAIIGARRLVGRTWPSRRASHSVVRREYGCLRISGVSYLTPQMP